MSNEPRFDHVAYGLGYIITREEVDISKPETWLNDAQDYEPLPLLTRLCYWLADTLRAWAERIEDMAP